VRPPSVDRHKRVELAGAATYIVGGRVRLSTKTLGSADVTAGATTALEYLGDAPARGAQMAVSRSAPTQTAPSRFIPAEVSTLTAGTVAGLTDAVTVESYDRGLVQTSERTYTFLQPDGGWGWSNAGLIVGDDEAILVDTFFDLANTRELLDAIERTVDRPVRRLVNTHHNGDHCWGNQLVEDATIVGHKHCRDAMLAVPPSFLAAVKAGDDDTDAVRYLKRAFEPFDFNGIEVTPPTVTFEDNLSLYLGPREIRLQYFGPCHTLGDVAVWVPDERVLFCGDLLFYGSTPLVWEGSLHNWIDTVDALLELDPRVVVPGHGPVTGADGLRAMQDYLRLVVTEGRRLKEQGLGPLDAAGELDLGDYAGWKDSERIALNFMRLWLELDGRPASEPVNTGEAFAAMAALA